MTRAAIAIALMLAAMAADAQTKVGATLASSSGNNVSGTVVFVEEGRKVFVIAEVTGLKPGPHGFHVHEKGDCSAADFSSAGGHFNPRGRKHGLKSPDGPHAGDLPNMLVTKDGSGRFEAKTDAFTLKSGAASIFDSDGSALVIHAGVDDYMTDPTGNAGDRAACGLIVAGK